MDQTICKRAMCLLPPSPKCPTKEIPIMDFLPEFPRPIYQNCAHIYYIYTGNDVVENNSPNSIIHHLERGYLNPGEGRDLKLRPNKVFYQIFLPNF